MYGTNTRKADEILSDFSKGMIIRFFGLRFFSLPALMWKKLQVPLRTFLPILNRIKWLLKTSFLTATCMRFFAVPLPKHFRQRKITASARSKIPYLRKNRENIIEKIFLKKSKNTIDKRLAAVYNTVKQLNKYSNVQKNRRRGGCPSGKVI